MARLPVIAFAALVAVPTIVLSQYTPEGAYAMRPTLKNTEPIYTGKLGYVDRNKKPWRPVTQTEWRRGVLKLDPTANKSRWRLDAKADYDGDGTLDTARLYTNGQQTAVIGTFGASKPPMVIFKDDGDDSGMELDGRGRRFLLSVPEVGYKILLMYRGRPAMMSQGD